MHIIVVIYSMHRSIGPHGAMHQICYGLPSQKQLVYELHIT